MPEFSRYQFERALSSAERKTKRVAPALLAITAIGLSAYSADVYSNMKVQKEASIDVEVISEALDPDTNNSAIVFLDGFGTYDADYLTRQMSDVAHEIVEGETWSVSYGNAPLNPRNIINDIIPLAEQRGITHVNLVGYSAGGIIGTQVAEGLIESSDLQVDTIGLISTPNGYDGLRKYQQKEMGMASWVSDIPGAVYSTPVRFIGEMYFRRDRYTEANLLQNVSNFFEVTGQVSEDLNKEKLPGTWLLVDQTLAISNAHFEENLETISKAKVKPVIYYLGTAKPGYDYMVDNKKSSNEICSLARKVMIECLIDNVPGAVHSLPAKAHKEYLETAQRIAPSVHDALERSLLRYYDSIAPSRMGSGDLFAAK